jgi:PAS domain-containing protein
MSTADIVAYIGAAAWLPQIGQWVYQFWTRPRLRVVPSAAIGITFTPAGPLVQLTCSINTDRRDTLIERMEIEVRHEQGEKRTFLWLFVSEFNQQLTAPTGEVLNFGRNQPATAIKLSTQSLSDRVILFQDVQSSKASRETIENLMDQYRFLKTSSEDAIVALSRSKEYRDARESFERSFSWKPGSYAMSVSLYSTELSKGHHQKFGFNLSVPDSDILKTNDNLFGEYVQARVSASEALPTREPTWKWVFPVIGARE